MKTPAPRDLNNLKQRCKETISPENNMKDKKEERRLKDSVQLTPRNLSPPEKKTKRFNSINPKNHHSTRKKTRRFSSTNPKSPHSTRKGDKSLEFCPKSPYQIHEKKSTSTPYITQTKKVQK